MAKYTSEPFGVKLRDDLKQPDKDQFATTYDILSEGPIEGLSNGLASIFINDVPIIQAQAENILKPRRFKANVTASTATITHTQFGEIDALSYQNKTGLSLGIRKVGIEKAGAKGTGIASATANSFTVTTSSAYFNTGMLAACRQSRVPIYLRIAGAGVNGTELRTKITSFTSTTEVRIADAIATTVSNVDIFFDHLCTLTAINGNVGTVSGAPVSTVSSASIQVSSPFIEGLNLSNLFNFKDVDIGFRVGNKIQPLLSPRDSEGTSTLFTPNLQLEQSNLRQSIGTTGNLSSSTYNDELEEPSQPEGTAADTVLTAAAMGVTSPSEVDQIDLTFAFPQSHAIKQANGTQGASFVELQIFFEYSTDGGSSFVSELAFGPSNNDILTRTGGRNGRNVNFVINGSTNIPNNGYIKPNPAQFTSFIEEFKIDTKQFQPFDTYRIRVRRITDLNFKDKSYQHTNPCTLQSVDNIVKDKLSYPYTSYASLSFNAKDFDSRVPGRSYLLKGRKVKVPTNYLTRDETGGAASYKRNVTSGAVESTYQNWDGNFRGDQTTFNEASVNYEEVYTDNPVWIFYDILTNKHYGLGQFIDEDSIDKYELFRLAKFCDEEVSDGEGGTEPRFTCNVYLTKAQEATNVLKQLASVFRGMAIWADGQLTAISDRPKKPIYTFTKANVKDGVFTYEGTGEKVKVNQVKVTWNDPADSYRQAVEYVEDTQSLIGDTNSPRLVRTELLAFGTTSRGQAHRLGKWKLLSEQLEKETISFTSGANVLGLKPGDIIAVQDADRDRASYSGRVSNFNPEAGLTLDATFDLINGGAISIGGGSNDTYPGGYFYTSSQESDRVLFAGEVTLPAKFSQAAVLWEHGGTGVGSWLGVRQLNGVYNLTLRSGEGSGSESATSADGIVTNVPIADIPEFDGGVHTICWAFRPDANPGTQKLWIDGKLYINDQTSSGAMENGEWSGGGHGGWLRATDATSGNLSSNAWPTTEGASGLRHYFGEDAGANLGLTTTQVLLDRNVTIPAYSSSFPPELLLIYPEGGAYLNQDSATISSVNYSKGDLIPTVTSSTAAANLVDDSNNSVDVYWSENARIETKTISSPGTSGGTVNALTVSSGFTSIPTSEVMWSLRIYNGDGTEATGTVKEYKVVAIKEGTDGEYELAASEYNINKFDLIERGYTIDPRPNDTFPNPEDEIPSPDNITVKISPGEFADQDSSDKNFFTTHNANITWDYPKNSDGSRYGFISGFEVTHNFKGKFITERVETQTQGLIIENVKGGTYEVSVRTISSIGTFSLENKRSFSFNQLHFTSPTVPSKEISLPKGGLITAPLSFVNGAFKAGDGSSAYQFTAPDGETETLSTSSTQNLTVANNSGDPTTGHSFILLDLTSNTKQLRQLVQVTDTTASPTKSYFKLNGASNEGLLTVNGTVVIEQYSNKVTGTNTNFDGDYEDGMLVKIPNGSSSTTQTTGASASNSTTITLSGTNNDIKIGQTVTGTIFGTDEATYTDAGGTTRKTAAGEISVVNISGTTLTVSAPITVASGVTLTFTPRSFYSRIVEIASDTLMFLEDICPRKYSGVQPQRLAYEPNPLKDSIIARTFSKNGVFSFVDFTEFTVADGALTISKISGDTIVTESEGIGSNDNDTTIPTSAAVKDYVENNAAAGTVDTTGTPADNQIAIFTDSNTLEGDSKLTFDGATLEVLKNGATAVIKVHEDAGTHTARFHLREGTQDTYLQNRPGNGFEIRTEGNISTSNNPAMQINSAGNITAGYNLTVSGNLTVDGTTTTINTADLNVEDKNITLNYHASNDTSSTANGSGITIQDAVDASTDATLLWDATNDEFDFSHKVTAPALSTTGGIISATANGLSQKHFELIDSADTSIRANIYHDNGIMSIESNNDSAAGQIVFKRRTSSTTVETARFDASGNFQFGASPTTILDPSRNLQNLESISLADGKIINIGSSNDLKLRHSTNSFIENYTGNLRIINYADDQDIIFESDDGSGGITSYFLLDGSQAQTRFEKDAQFGDSIKLKIGSAGDLSIQHNGTDSKITNNTGTLEFRQNVDDGDITFRSDDGSGGTAEYFRLDGANVQMVASQKIAFSDNVRATFGNSSDLQIYHNGSNSFISDTGTGELGIGSDFLRIMNGALSENMATFAQDGAVTLFHNNATRLATTASGIDVTGQIELGDGHLIGNDSFDNLTLLSSSGEHIVISASEDIYFKTGGSSLSSTGNTRMHVDATTGYVGIGALNASSRLLLHGGGSYNQLRLEESATDNQDKRAGLSFTQYDVDEEGFLGIGGFASSTENAVLLGGGTGTFNAATRVDIVTAANNTTTAGSVRLRVDTSGHVDLLTGNLKINGTTVIDTSRNLHNIGTISNSGNITSTGSAHTFYSGGSTGQLSVGRSSDQSIQIYVDDTNNKITAFQDSDSDGTHRFILDREFQGTGANTFHIRKDGADQFTLDGSAKATFSGEVHIPTVLVHVGDTDTTAGFHGNDLFRVVTGGTERFEVSNSGIIINDGSADYDFRVESNGNANMLFVDGGNDRVGIGTGSPSVKFEVNGGADAIAKITGTSTAARLDLATTTHHVFMQVIESDGRFRIYDQTAANEYLTISNAGNVGIKKSAPLDALHVTGVIRTQMDGNNAKYIRLFGGNSGNFLDTYGNALFIRPSATTSLASIFRVDGTVGISNTLDIDHDMDAAVPTSTNSNLFLRDTNALAAENGGAIVFSGIYDTNGNHLGQGPYIKGYKVNANSGDYGFGLKLGVRQTGSGGSNVAITINDDSNIGIGTTNPQDKLQIETGNIHVKASSGKYKINSLDVIEYSSGFRIGAVADDDEALTLVGFGGQPNIVLGDSLMQFKYSTSEKMRLDSSGNLGIATTSPAEKLDVLGVGKVRGTGDGTAVLKLGQRDNNASLELVSIFTDDAGSTRSLGGDALEFHTNRHLQVIGATRSSAAGSPVRSWKFTATSNSDERGTDLLLYNQADASATGSTNTTVGVQISSTSNRSTYFNAGNVAIGNTSAGYKLDVGGTTASTSNTLRLHQNNGGTAIRIGAGSGDSDVVIWRIDGAGAANAGATDAGNYGFSLKYFGSGTGNENRLKLLADNQANATQNVVWESNQTGTITFQQNVILSSTTNLKHNTDTILDTNKNLSNIANISHSGGFTQNAGSTVNSTYVYSTNTSGQPGFVAANNTSGNEDRSLLMKYYGTAVSATIFGQNVGGKVIVAASGSANGGLLLGSGNSATNAPVYMGTGGNLALTIDTSQNVTLENNLIFGNGSITSDSTEFIFDGADGKEVIIKSARDVRIIIDDNNDDTNNQFEIFKHNDDSASNKILNLTQAGALTINSAYTFPTSDGSANQVLQTDGSGNLSFANAGGGTITSATNMSDNRVLTASGSTTINGEANLTFNGSNLGIGESNPQALLHVTKATGGTTGTVIAAGTDAGILLQDSNSPSANYFVSKIHNPGNGNAIGGIKFAVSPDSANFSWAGIKALTSASADADILAFYTSASNTSGDSSTERMRIDESGRVGIGTTSPDGQLDVRGTSISTILARATSGNSQARVMVQNDARAYSFKIHTDDTLQIKDETADAARIKISTGGNVSIGGDPNPGGTTATLSLGPGSNATESLVFAPATGGVGEFRNTSSSGFFKFTNQNGSTELVRIDSSGNVGIGTTSPSSILHVKATTAQIKINSNDGNSAFLTFGDASDTTRGGLEYTSDDALVFETNNMQERMRIDSSGNVGIGVASPNQRLVIADSTGETTLAINNSTQTVGNRSRIDFRHNGITGSQIKSGAIEDFTTTANRTSDLRFFTRHNGTIAERLRIKEDGNVGIGTDSPDRKLEVENTAGNGEVAISGTTGADLYFRPTTSYSAGGNFGIKVDGGTSSPFLSTMEFSGYNNGINAIMTLKGDGKVGIGTTSPSHKLDIVGGGLEITQEETTDAIALLDSNNSNTKYLSIQGDSGDCNINAPAGSLVLQRAGTQRLTVGTTGVAVNGLLSATTKSFIIDHPTKEGMKLRYGSLEGPENGVYARGRLRGNIIELPEYWTELVHEDSITVNLTPIGKHQKLYVEDIKDNQVIVGNENLLGKEINCFYTVYAERKDVEKFEVEYNE